MKKFIFLSYGFKTPTPDIMTVWKQWSESMKGNMVEMIGLGSGREISKAGVKELPLGLESITGVMIVNAESLEAAEKLAQSNPYITSIRVYEVRGH